MDQGFLQRVSEPLTRCPISFLSLGLMRLKSVGKKLIKTGFGYRQGGWLTGSVSQ